MLLQPSTFDIQRSADRYHGDHGWLQTAQSFSFADYVDPQRMNWGTLRVFNDDRVAPGTGFGTHPHRDMDIVTYVLDGRLEHRDSMGNHGIVARYGVQYMSAGTGVRHSEYNASKADGLHFLQMWVLPRHAGVAPAYGQRDFTAADVADRWLTVASGDAASDAAIALDADATLRVGELGASAALDLTVAPGRLGFVFVAEGAPQIDDAASGTSVALAAGDALRLDASARLRVRGAGHIVWWDVAPLDA